MNIKPWKIICFLVVIVGATIIVHPSKKHMIHNYVETGRLDSAWGLINDLLAKNPMDNFATGEAVRLYLLEGKPDKAITLLEEINQKSGLTSAQLEQLAMIYEWRRKLKKAIDTWERLLKKDPGNRSALTMLINHYRYCGNLAGEKRCIVQLIDLDEAAGKWEKNGKWMKDLIGGQISLLKASNADDAQAALSAMLASGLNQLYGYELAKPSDDNPLKRAEMLTRCLEQFVWSGYLEAGEAFAVRVDDLWQTGIAQQLRFATVLRWNKLDAYAFSLLTALLEKHPGERRIFEAMAGVADQVAKPEKRLELYKTLVNMNPDKPEYQKRLAQIYLETKKSDQVIERYKALYAKARDPKWDIQLLELAVQSGDQAFQKTCLDMVLQHKTKDPRILKQCADLCLAMDKPGRAYPLLKQTITAPGSKRSDFETLLQVAGFSDNARIMADALSTVRQMRPKDPNLLSQVADGWLSLSRPGQAYLTMRHLTALNGNPSKDIHRCLEFAWHTGKPDLMSDAQTWAMARYKANLAKNPKDKDAADGLAQLTTAPKTPRQDLGKEIAKARKKSDANPRNAGLALAAGRVLVGAGRLKDGAKYLQRAADLRPKDPVVWRELVNVYEWSDQTGKLLNALKHLSRIAKLNPRHRSLLADMFMNKKQWSRAIGILEPLVGENDLPRQEGLMLIEAYSQVHNHKGAGLIIKKMAGKYSRETKFMARLGQQAQWNQQLPLALEIYGDVLKKDADNLTALKGSGQIYAWTGKIDKALVTLKTYNRLFQNDYETWYLLGEVYLGKQQNAQAKKAFKKAKRLIDAAGGKAKPSGRPSIWKGA